MLKRLMENMTLTSLPLYKQIMSKNDDLRIPTAMLFRKILKHLHKGVPRELQKQAKIEEFRFLFAQIDNETNMMKKYKLLKVMDDGQDFNR